VVLLFIAAGRERVASGSLTSGVRCEVAWESVESTSARTASGMTHVPFLYQNFLFCFVCLREREYLQMFLVLCIVFG
jgi:hypothetical protein